MYALFEQYYTTTDFNQFCIDLAEKDEVFIFRSEHELIGFSTIFKKKTPTPKGPATLIYSGDTVIRRDFWGQKFLQRRFFWYIVRAKLSSPWRPVYWMLISKGFKTYLMMRRNFRHSFPNSNLETPAIMKAVMDKFYLGKFGTDYKSQTGRIEFPKLSTAVRDGIACPTGNYLKDPEVQFYLKQNPEFEKGTELACIAEIRIQDFLLHIPKFFLPKFLHKKATAERPVQALPEAGS